MSDNHALYAMRPERSRGRKWPEPDHPYRSHYERDRDRIVHSTAFRRLMHKTQVLLTQTNDHHRTRLTHTLEVAQIARTVARRLRLDEDLTEAIALSHDLGHPPFGHAGEEALDSCMLHHGGFEHNLHGLRLIEHLEYPYPDFPGLNLTHEVREAMALHSRRVTDPARVAYADVGSPLLEAQVADASDSLAYVAHDVDDALAAELISPQDLTEVRLWQQALAAVQARYGMLGLDHLRPAMVRMLIEMQVSDLLENTRALLRENRVRGVEDVRAFDGVLVKPGERMGVMKAELSAFLRARVYYSMRVERMAHKGARIVKALFAEFRASPQLMPARYALAAREGVERAVCDYLAGMTDRYAQDEYLRMFHPYTPI